MTQIFALVENGVVVQRSKWENDTPPEGQNWIAETDAQIGWTYDDQAQTFAPPVVAPVSSVTTVNEERDRRLALGFDAVLDGGARSFPVQTRDLDDWTNIHGRVTYAQVLLSTSPSTTINFRDADNVIQVVTPDEMISIGLQALAHKQSHHDAAWTLKDTSSGVPADFTDDTYWPAA